MSQTTIVKRFKYDGVLTNPTTITIHVTRTDTGADVVAAGTAMTQSATGIYYTTFTDPAASLTYEYTATITYGGIIYTSEGSASGGADASGDLYDLTGIVEPILPGCPLNLIKQYLRLAFVDFCERTEVWDEEFSAIASVAEQADYTLTHSFDAEIRRVWKVEYDEIPWTYTLSLDIGTLTMDPIPQTDDDDIVPFCIMVPTFEGTGIPTWMLNRWGHTIAYGAMWMLASMEKKAWGNRGVAETFKRRYRGGLARASQEASTKRGTALQRIKLRRFLRS